jgi:hypothetical protein
MASAIANTVTAATTDVCVYVHHVYTNCDHDSEYRWV